MATVDRYARALAAAPPTPDAKAATRAKRIFRELARELSSQPLHAAFTPVAGKAKRWRRRAAQAD